MILKTLVNWGWSAIVITVLAVISYIYEWPREVMIPILVVILAAGMVVGVVKSHNKELEQSMLELRQLAAYFNRRFMGESSLSIFAIINTLFNIDNPKLWEWARSCDMSRRIFNTWCDSFIGRVESDVKTRSFDVYTRTYLNELWLANARYHEFIEQFYEIAEQVEIPRETIDQYNRFVMEYNAFVQNLRDNISQLRKVAKAGIEAPSVRLAKELPAAK